MSWTTTRGMRPITSGSFGPTTATHGRLYGVHPAAGERFVLRILLNKVPGSTCFDDLKTYNDVVHLTFRDACVARGLLESAEEWIKCLEEANVYQMPQACPCPCPCPRLCPTFETQSFVFIYLESHIVYHFDHSLSFLHSVAPGPRATPLL